MKALDYSGGNPSGASVKAAGYDGVIRYLKKKNPSGVVVLTAAEYNDKSAHGVGVALVFEETNAGRMLEGAAAGNVDGEWALAQARACGIEPRCIYFACDVDAQPYQYAAVDAYLRAAAQHLGADKVGVYGGYYLVKHCHEAGSAKWLWQTRAWSGGNVYGPIHILQNIGYVNVGGVTCDWNQVYQGDFGQHPNPGGAVKPPVKDEHTKTNEEEDMNFAYRDPRDGALYLIGGNSRLHFMDGNDYARIVKDKDVKVLKLTAEQLKQKHFVQALKAPGRFLIQSPKNQCRLVGNGFSAVMVGGGNVVSLQAAGVELRKVSQKTFDSKGVA